MILHQNRWFWFFKNFGHFPHTIPLQIFHFSPGLIDFWWFLVIFETHDVSRYKFSESIKNDRKALELWGFGFWNFTCIRVHWRFPNYKFKIFSKNGISHLKEIWPHIWADVVETSRFSTKFNDFVKIMKIKDLKNDQILQIFFEKFYEKSFIFLSNFFGKL